MKTKNSITFKKGKRNTGLYACGTPREDTQIKLNKKRIGWINATNWQTNVHKVHICIEKNDIMEDGNPNCSWRNVTFKAEFTEELDAMNFAKEKILPFMERNNYKFHYHGDE